METAVIIKVRVTKSSGYMRPVDDYVEMESLPQWGDIIQLHTDPFIGSFRVDEVELPMTGNNSHRSLPLLYVHSMQREY